MPSLLEQISSTEKHLELLKERLDKQRANKKLLCGCGDLHRIKECSSIRQLSYVSPSGCAEGDYWRYQETIVVCPSTGLENRLLYNSRYNVPVHLRDKYEHSAEMQFSRMYDHLFKSKQERRSERGGNSVYNVYVDTNHTKFDITLKETK